MALSVTKKRLFQKNKHSHGIRHRRWVAHKRGWHSRSRCTIFSASAARGAARCLCGGELHKRRGGSLRRARIDGSRANPSSDFVMYKTDVRMGAVWLSTTRVCATFVTSRRKPMRGMCDANPTPATGTAWCQLSRVHAKCVTAPHVHVWDLQATQMPHARTREARTCHRRVGAAARQRARQSGVRL